MNYLNIHTGYCILFHKFVTERLNVSFYVHNYAYSFADVRRSLRIKNNLFVYEDVN